MAFLKCSLKRKKKENTSFILSFFLSVKGSHLIVNFIQMIFLSYWNYFSCNFFVFTALLTVFGGFFSVLYFRIFSFIFSLFFLTCFFFIYFSLPHFKSRISLCSSKETLPLAMPFYKRRRVRSWYFLIPLVCQKVSRELDNFSSYAYWSNGGLILDSTLSHFSTIMTLNKSSLTQMLLSFVIILFVTFSFRFLDLFYIFFLFFWFIPLFVTFLSSKQYILVLWMLASY